MNKIYSFAQQMLVGALALSLATVASADNVPQVVTVLKVHGSARYSTDNKTWQPIKTGLVLSAGSVIQTAEDSSVDVMMSEPSAVSSSAGPTLLNMPGNVTQQFGATGAASTPAITTAANSMGTKGNVIHIFPSSVLAIDKLVVEKTGVDEVDETQLDLRAGQILGNVKKLSAASRYEVKLPNGVAGIRGTTYIVSATGAVMVLDGSVVVSYMVGTTVYTQTVSAGESFNPFVDPNTGQPTATPQPNNIGPGGKAGLQLTNIPPAQANALTTLYTSLNLPPQLVPTQFTQGPTGNQTVISISPL